MSSAYVVTNQRAKTERIRFLLRSWYNTADVDARTQNPDLRLQQLKMSFVAGDETIAERESRARRRGGPYQFLLQRQASPKARKRMVYQGGCVFVPQRGALDVQGSVKSPV
jgi:hypothetical protein